MGIIYYFEVRIMNPEKLKPSEMAEAYALFSSFDVGFLLLALLCLCVIIKFCLDLLGIINLLKLKIMIIV